MSVNALIRAIWPDFDPGATVEGAGIEPSPEWPIAPVDLAPEMVKLMESGSHV